MINSSNKIPLRKAALYAGIVILVIALVAPFAEVYLYPKLVDLINPPQTIHNIINNKALFVSMIFSYLLTFAGDIVLSWLLYILLAPVHKHLSLLTALFRLAFALIALTALLNLVTVFQLLSTDEYSVAAGRTQLNIQIILCFKTFRSNYHFGIIFFSIHLMLLGYLVIKSGYINRMMGVVLIICGLGYLTDALKPFLFPNLNSSFITITFFGELIFMLWLLIKGYKIEDKNDTT
jgi:hypothetical protein